MRFIYTSLPSMRNDEYNHPHPSIHLRHRVPRNAYNMVVVSKPPVERMYWCLYRANVELDSRDDPANLKVFQGTLGLCSPIFVCGHLHRAHGVALFAETLRGGVGGGATSVKVAALGYYTPGLRYATLGLHQLQEPRPDVLTHFCYFFVTFFYPIESQVLSLATRARYISARVRG